jgi:prepilin-type N-terminal cleavage/methylation domain-containing protein
MMFDNSHKQSGFSLVETLVAITILLIVITGPLTLVSNSARSTNFANDQVMANFLAQEGLELAQAARDNLLIPEFSASPPITNAWERFSSAVPPAPYARCFNPNGCGLDQNTNAGGTLNVSDCLGTGAGCRLYSNSDLTQRSRYTHGDNSGANSPTQYTRVIRMNNNVSGQIEIISRVTWRSDGQRAEQVVEAVTYVFDVYGR